MAEKEIGNTPKLSDAETKLPITPEKNETDVTLDETLEQRARHLESIFRKLKYDTIYADGRLSLHEVPEFALDIASLSRYDKGYLVIHATFYPDTFLQTFEKVTGHTLSRTETRTRAYSQVEHGNPESVNVNIQSLVSDIGPRVTPSDLLSDTEVANILGMRIVDGKIVFDYKTPQEPTQKKPVKKVKPDQS